MQENKSLEEALKSYREEALQTLQRWIRQPSVKGECAGEGAPFGPDTRRMLDIALEDCKRLGLDVKDIDGYAGQADMGQGDDRDALGILSHLDVVPVGTGWQKEPFGAEVAEEKVFGRGTSDDKGPAVAALYAMAAVKKAGIPLKRKVRLILGCDEETGMDDIKYYKTHATMPRSGFSPDADYPVINIEKGGCHLKLSGSPSKEGVQVLSFNVGERINVIPGVAEATFSGDAELLRKSENAAKTLNFPIKAVLKGKDSVTVETYGKTGHAAMGENARNAIGQMLLIMREVGVLGAYKELADFVGMTYHGEKMGIAMEDGISGKLTCSLDIIRGDQNGVEASLDIRYPVLCNTSWLLQVAQTMLEGHLKVEMPSDSRPHFVSENSALVRELLAAYEDVTGEKGKPLAIGGGTYARTMEEGVAFGALFPGEKEMAHQADEYISLDSFYKNMRIFAYAIVRLAGK